MNVQKVYLVSSLQLSWKHWKGIFTGNQQSLRMLHFFNGLKIIYLLRVSATFILFKIDGCHFFCGHEFKMTVFFSFDRDCVCLYLSCCGINSHVLDWLHLQNPALPLCCCFNCILKSFLGCWACFMIYIMIEHH